MVGILLKHFIIENAIDVFFENMILNFKKYKFVCKGSELNRSMHGKLVTVSGRNLLKPITGKLCYPIMQFGSKSSKITAKHAHLADLELTSIYGIIEPDDIMIKEITYYDCTILVANQYTVNFEYRRYRSRKIYKDGSVSPYFFMEYIGSRSAYHTHEFIKKYI